MIPIPWTEEPGGLQPMVLQRVGHDQVWACAHTHTHTHTHMNYYKRMTATDYPFPYETETPNSMSPISPTSFFSL